VWDVALRRSLTLLPLFVGVAEPWSLSVTRRSTSSLWAAVGLARATGMPGAGGVRVPDDGAYVWFGNLASTGQASLLKSNTYSVNATAISPDDRLLVAGGDGAEPANVWDITTRSQPTRVAMIAPSRDADINANRDLGALDFGADPRYVGAVYGSGGSGGVIRVIDATTGMVVREHYKKLAYYPVSVAMRPTGGMMVVGEVACGMFAVCSN
jgi:WD40 repeat protein